MGQVLVILRGGPASGKSSVCEEVQKRNSKIVWLHVDSFKRFVNTGNKSSDRNHWYGASAASLNYFLKNGFSVLAEGIFQYHEHMQLFLQTAEKYVVKGKVFELASDPEILIQRDKTRKGVPQGLREPLPKETIKKLAFQIRDSHFPNAEIIDTDKESLDSIIEKILKEFD